MVLRSQALNCHLYTLHTWHVHGTLAKLLLFEQVSHDTNAINPHQQLLPSPKPSESFATSKPYSGMEYLVKA